MVSRTGDWFSLQLVEKGEQHLSSGVDKRTVRLDENRRRSYRISRFAVN